MERLSRRGKIPQKDWPSIIARHEAGETLASIARTYDCSPPAISYIVSRSRKRNLAAQAASPQAPAAEQQLLKTHPLHTQEAAGPRSAESGAERREPAAARSPFPAAPSGEPPRPLQPLFDRNQPTVDRNPLLKRDPLAVESGGPRRAAAPAFASPNGGQRRILHLSLGPSGDDDAIAANHPYSQHPQTMQSSERMALRPAAQAAPAAGHAETPFPGRAHAFEPAIPSRAREPHGLREGSPSLDPALRHRVEADIAAFLAAFDGALAHDTAESRTLLREATDRLLRAGARTRIELERLEARSPLPPRGKGEESGSAWGRR